MWRVKKGWTDKTMFDPGVFFSPGFQTILNAFAGNKPSLDGWSTVVLNKVGWDGSLGGVRYRAPLRCLQFAFDKIKRWGKEHLIRCLQFAVDKIIRLTRRWMCPDPSCFFSPEQMMCQSLFTQSVGQWVIVSDFGDSYCIYQACKLSFFFCEIMQRCRARKRERWR